MECSVCGTGDELLYRCGRCGRRLCATHQGRPYHECVPSPEGDWTPPGTRDTSDGGRIALDYPTDGGTAADDAADSTGDATDRADDGTDGGSRSAGASAATASAAPADEGPPPDATRPGYGPDRLRPDPVEPADSVPEWFRRQTYLSLTAKVGLIATLWNGLVFSALAIALAIAPA